MLKAQSAPPSFLAARLTTDDSALVFVVADESMTDGRAHDGTHDRAASRERVRARARSNCSWKGYRHGAAFDLEPKLANGCAHRSRASAHLSEQMQSSGAIARVQINGATRIAQSLHMPVSISVLIKSVDPKEGPSPRA